MRIILSIIILFLGLPLFAQDEAKEILDKSAEKIKALKAVEINFDLVMENTEEKIREEHKGQAIIKDLKYKLEIMDVISYFDGTNIYTYMPDVDEVNIKLPSEEDEELLNPATIFDIHNNDFKQKLISQEKGIAYIELYPKNLDKNFFKIGVWINTENYMIQRVKTFGKDASNLIIEIKKIRQPEIIPEDSFFVFNPEEHPDVDVIDLR